MATPKKSASAKKKIKKAAKQPDLTALYRHKAAQFDVADQEFRVSLYRPKTKNTFNIDGYLEDLEWGWEEGDPTLRGRATFRDPRFGSGQYNHSREGDVITLKIRHAGKVSTLWKMRLRDEEVGIDGVYSYSLADDSIILQESSDKFSYKKDKAHPQGWYAHEILLDVCRQYGIKPGRISRGKHRIKALSGEMSPMECIVKAYNMERKATGRRFIARWESGKVHVESLQRNELLYLLKEQIEGGTLAYEERDDKFATVITAKATVKRGKKKQKLSYRYVDRDMVMREGMVHRPVNATNVDNMAELRTWAKRYIARHSRRKRLMTNVQHRGIAFIRRGDVLRVSLPEYGFTGAKSVCFVTAGTWNLAAGAFTMSLTLTFDDPYKLSAADSKARAAARKKTKK